MEYEATEAQAIAELALTSAVPHQFTDNLYSVVVPAQGRAKLLDLARFDPAPRRKHGTVTVYTAESLVAYVDQHTLLIQTNPDAPARAPLNLYADADARLVTAVLNDHNNDRPGWGDHRAVLTLRHTPAWAAWAAMNGRIGGQTAFAEHIEDNLPDIVDPPGADMLEMAQTFEATTSVAFRSAQRLDSGQVQLRYEESTDARAGKGNIPIPAAFVVGVAPFEGSDPYRLTARLRYRIRDGALTIGYVLHRPEDVLRAAFDEILSVVEGGLGTPALRGAPPVPLTAKLPDWAT